MTEKPMTNSAELLPCPNPWCDDRSVADIETREGGFFRVGCTCGVATPAYTTEQQAIAAWNERPCTNQILFAETGILLTHPDEERKALAKERIFAILFPDTRRAESRPSLQGDVVERVAAAGPPSNRPASNGNSKSS